MGYAIRDWDTYIHLVCILLAYYQQQSKPMALPSHKFLFSALKGCHERHFSAVMRSRFSQELKCAFALFVLISTVFEVFADTRLEGPGEKWEYL